MHKNRRLWQLVRIGITVCVVAVVVTRVPWRTTATLADGRQVVVAEQVGGGIYIHADDGGRQFVPNEQLASVAGRGGGQEPAIEKGLRDELGHLQWWAVIVAVFVFTGAPLLQALRWRALLRVQNVRLSVVAAVRLMWIGMLFNMFLLGAVGGDLIKAYYVSKHTDSRAESAITVFVDRIIGLLGLLWLSAAGIGLWLVSNGQERNIPGGLPWAWMLPGVAVLLAGIVFYSRRIRRWTGLNWLVHRVGPGHVIRRLDRAVFLYRHHKAIVLQAFVLTFLSHLCLLGAVYLANVAVLGENAAGWDHVLVFGPMIFVGSGLIPSVGGLGVQEFGFVLFFSYLGFGTRAGALFLGIVVRAVQIIVSLPGGLLLATGGHLPSKEQMQAEMQQVPSS